MHYTCVLGKLVSQQALTIKSQTSANELSNIFSLGYAQLREYLAEYKEAPAGPAFAIYHDMDRKNLNVEFGYPVSASLSGNANIHLASTPTGKAVSCTHIGPYADLEHAYFALLKWVKDNGYEVSGITYEVYLNDPEFTPQDRLVTQVFLLIRSISL